MNTKNKGDEPAFPLTWMDHNSMGVVAVRETFPGLTKRQLFAAMAMQGQLSDYKTIFHYNNLSPRGEISLAKLIAATSVEFADALLAELGKEGEE
jgi:hypothetical protein